MNVIVSNKYSKELLALNLDTIRSINGTFDANQLANEFKNLFYNKMIIDITAIKDYKEINSIQKLSISFDMSKVIIYLGDNETCNSNIYLSNLISVGIYNFTKNIENVPYLINNPNSYKDVAALQQLGAVSTTVMSRVQSGETRVIGIKNATTHAGSTSLIYMLKKFLSKYYKTLALELEKNDFMFFDDKEMISVTQEELSKYILRSKDYDVILIDLNRSNNDDVCNIVINLIEPTPIKLARLMRRGASVFNNLQSKTVVLNQSFLSKKEIKIFENESKLKVFYSIPPLNVEFDQNQVMGEFADKLGFKIENEKN